MGICSVMLLSNIPIINGRLGLDFSKSDIGFIDCTEQTFYEVFLSFALVGEYFARQGDVRSDLCGAAGTYGIREAVICHHTAGFEDPTDPDRTQLWRLSPENVCLLCLALIGLFSISRE